MCSLNSTRPFTVNSNGIYALPPLCVVFPTYFYEPKTKELYGSIWAEYDSVNDKVANTEITDKTIMLLSTGKVTVGLHPVEQEQA